MRAKNRAAGIKDALLAIASHSAMGIAVGLAFAFLLTHVPAFGVLASINLSPAPAAVVQLFEVTCATTFGIGATLTGLAIMLTENPGTTPPTSDG